MGQEVPPGLRGMSLVGPFEYNIFCKEGQPKKKQYTLFGVGTGRGVTIKHSVFYVVLVLRRSRNKPNLL